MNLLYGMLVIIDKLAVTKTWVYPKERFWEYIPSAETERWCRYFGYGHEIETPCCYQVGNKWIMHPAIWEALKKEIVIKKDVVYQEAKVESNNFFNSTKSLYETNYSKMFNSFLHTGYV